MAKALVFFVFIYLLGQIISSAVDGNVGIAATTLTAAVSENETSTINVVTTSGFESTGFVLIDSEIVCYTSLTSTTFVTLTRGCRETSAASHKSGKKVFNETTGVVNQGVGFQLASATTEAGPLKVLTALPGFLGTSLPRLIAWDYSFMTGEVYGFPLVYFQYIGLTITMGLVISFFLVMLTTFGSFFRRVI